MYSLSYPVKTDQNIDDSSCTTQFFCQIKFFLTNDNVPPYETTLNWLAQDYQVQSSAHDIQKKKSIHCS